MLDREERLKELRPEELLRDVAGIANGMVCVDIGSGTGAFALPMARLVGEEGVVYAVDDNAIMLEHTQNRQPPRNLKLVHSDGARTGLAGQIADFCLLAFVLHEVRQPQRLLTEAFRLLKPGGKVLVVEWKADRDSPGPPRRIRLPGQRVERLLEKAGFSSAGSRDWSINHYIVLGVKKAGAVATGSHLRPRSPESTL